MKLLIVTFITLAFVSCNQFTESNYIDDYTLEAEKHYVSGYEPINEDGSINAVIEIPAGTTEKWEVDKETGNLAWEFKEGVPRKVKYIGYPGNYGMIPKTLLSEENGGDGDPLDILVLGEAAKRGEILECKIIGVLYLKDRGEQDDKLIGVSKESPFYHVNSIKELNKEFNGISDIIKTWFTNYKGKGMLKSKGYGNKKKAQKILDSSIEQYQECLKIP